MDNSHKIIEDIKWFLYNEGETIVQNCFGFEHGTTFVSWVGDSHSFIINDGKDEYRLTITKEEL